MSRSDAEEKDYRERLRDAQAIASAVIELAQEEHKEKWGGITLVACAHIVAHVIATMAEGKPENLKEHMDPWLRGLAHEVAKAIRFEQEQRAKETMQ